MAQYATAAELQTTGLPAAALASLDPIPFLVNASNLVDSYLQGRYRLPLPVPADINVANTYPSQLREAVIAIAAWDILTFRGHSPSQIDETRRERRNFYLGDPERGTKGWLDKLSAGAVSLPLPADSTPEVHEGSALVVRGAGRGWDTYESTQLGELEGNFWHGGNR